MRHRGGALTHGSARGAQGLHAELSSAKAELAEASAAAAAAAAHAAELARLRGELQQLTAAHGADATRAAGLEAELARLRADLTGAVRVRVRAAAREAELAAAHEAELAAARAAAAACDARAGDAAAALRGQLCEAEPAREACAERAAAACAEAAALRGQLRQAAAAAAEERGCARGAAAAAEAEAAGGLDALREELRAAEARCSRLDAETGQLRELLQAAGGAQGAAANAADGQDAVALRPEEAAPDDAERDSCSPGPRPPTAPPESRGASAARLEADLRAAQAQVAHLRAEMSERERLIRRLEAAAAAPTAGPRRAPSSAGASAASAATWAAGGCEQEALWAELVDEPAGDGESGGSALADKENRSPRGAAAAAEARAPLAPLAGARNADPNRDESGRAAPGAKRPQAPPRAGRACVLADAQTQTEGPRCERGEGGWRMDGRDSVCVEGGSSAEPRAPGGMQSRWSGEAAHAEGGRAAAAGPCASQALRASPGEAADERLAAAHAAARRAEEAAEALRAELSAASLCCAELQARRPPCNHMFCICTADRVAMLIQLPLPQPNTCQSCARRAVG